MGSMFKKVMSVVVAAAFLFNGVAFGLSPAVTSGSLGDPETRDTINAGGRMFWAAAKGPGTELARVIDASLKSAARERLEAEALKLDGIFVKADYDNLPNGWESNPILKETSLVKAFEMFRDTEAKIPAEALIIKEGYFYVDEAKGELPLAAIEDNGNGTYTLIIHTKFVQMWNHIRANDVWRKVRLSPLKHDVRVASLAWDIFYRVAKHEMQDLVKINGKAKQEDPYRAHISNLAGQLSVSSNEELANGIGGRYSLSNDAGWMWFLGSYCFGDATRFSNQTLQKRLEWFLHPQDPQDAALGLSTEFRSFINEAEENEAIEHVIALNSKFFGRPGIDVPELTVDEKYIDEWKARKGREISKSERLVKEYFPTMGKIEYKGPDSKDIDSFHYYNPDAPIDAQGKTMSEYFRFSAAWWHALKNEGGDPFGPGNQERPWLYDGATEMERAYNTVDAAFELMQKLGIKYYAFHDRDVAPVAKNADGTINVKKTEENLWEIVRYMKEKQDQTGIKLLWGTANLFSDKLYAQGAGTSGEIDVIANAAAQVKTMMDITKFLDGENYVFWGGREGYYSLLNTDMKLELDDMARLLTIARDYAKEIGLIGGPGNKKKLFIEPKACEPTGHQYDFDAATAIGFLRQYNLFDDFYVNVEANHATLAGHTFMHELMTCANNGKLGSIDFNSGGPRIGAPRSGWDVDWFPGLDDAIEAMLVVYPMGGLETGGFHFDAKAHRTSTKPEDIIRAHLDGMDAAAAAYSIVKNFYDDVRVQKILHDRYKSLSSETGIAFREGRLTLKDLYDIAVKKNQPILDSANFEMINRLMNEHILNCHEEYKNFMAAKTKGSIPQVWSFQGGAAAKVAPEAPAAVSVGDETVDNIIAFTAKYAPLYGPGSERENAVLNANSENIYKTIELLKANKIEIFLPGTVGVNDTVNNTLAKIRQKYGEDAVVCRQFIDSTHLQDLLSRPAQDGTQRVVVLDNNDDAAKRLAANLPSLFVNVRMWSVALPDGYAGLSKAEKSVYQADIVVRAMVTGLLKKDGNPFVAGLFKAMFKNRIPGGDIEGFMNRLIADPNETVDMARSRITYMLTRVVSLVEKIGEQLVILKHLVWSAA